MSFTQASRRVLLWGVVVWAVWSMASCATKPERVGGVEGVAHPWWPEACRAGLGGVGCDVALLTRLTSDVCDKNSVAGACLAGIAVLSRVEGVERERLVSDARRACAEGAAGGCLLEASFALETKTPRGWMRAERIFRRLCSPQDPAACLVAGEALLHVGARSEVARPYLDTACQHGRPEGCRVLGLAYRRRGEEAQNAFEKGCFAGDVASCRQIEASDDAGEGEQPPLPALGMAASVLVGEAERDCAAAKQPDCVLWGQIARLRLPADRAGEVAQAIFREGCEAGAADACFFEAEGASQGDGSRSCERGWLPACAAPEETKMREER